VKCAPTKGHPRHPGLVGSRNAESFLSEIGGSDDRRLWCSWDDPSSPKLKPKVVPYPSWHRVGLPLPSDRINAEVLENE